MTEPPFTRAGEAPADALTADDLWLFAEGRQTRLYRKLGAHLVEEGGASGVRFRVWAPSASAVSVIGDFNGWEKSRHPLERGDGGIWGGFVPGLESGALYKYHVVGPEGRFRGDKADPLAFCSEEPPRQASVVWSLDYRWSDEAWMERRDRIPLDQEPVAVYEVHLGSWQRSPGGEILSYAEVAPRLATYVREQGFTHVELLPVMEHPFYGSWGYQVTGFYSPSRRYGTPQDLMRLIDYLHQEGIGVILDWVPSHFPTDGHGLAYFDGTHLYEHSDPRRGWHPDWRSFIFDYGRGEVVSFLISSALFWLDRYHADGLRVDAVASMLYLDFSRPDGEWIPNRYGGRENLEAVAFLRAVNEAVAARFPSAVMVAEDSSAWPMVTRAPEVGGLGFTWKWDMGWMNDTLRYFALDPVHRKFHHQLVTFRPMYASFERFILPLSHDEVVHGKGSLLGKMPGTDEDKLSNLRLLIGWMYAVPGKKLLFMGDEIGQWQEWSHDRSLDWQLLDYPRHRGVQEWVRDLNHLYRESPALHRGDFGDQGFEWVDCHDWEQSVVSLLRHHPTTGEVVLVVCNFTPVQRDRYRLGVPCGGRWEEVLNSDAATYGGWGVGNLGGVEAWEEETFGRPHSVELTLPILSAVFFRHPGVAPAVVEEGPEENGRKRRKRQRTRRRPSAGRRESR